MSPIYGKVNEPQDISRINCIIRDEMLVVQTPEQLTDLKKRTDYLCILTYSPFWKKKFGDNITELREIAIKENRITVKVANYVAKYKGFNKQYEPWKKDINISDQLKQIPSQVLQEFTESIFTMQRTPSILDQLRVQFCDIRKAMVLCEDVSCLDKLKRAVDILSVLPFLDYFADHFDKDTLKKIDDLINKEKSRSILLANIIAQVQNWERLYQSIGQEDFETTAYNYLEKLLKEEQKASTYIPTEAKYKGGAKVLWLVYYHPDRKREFAKRIYFPADAYDLQVEGPGEFKNKFGNKVYGIKVTYKSKIGKAIVKIRGKELYLPERVVTRSKIIQVPNNAQNIRLVDQRPKSAMSIA